MAARARFRTAQAVPSLPNARPIAFSDSPRCQRSHNSVFSAAVKPRRIPGRITIHSIFPFEIKCCVDQLRAPPKPDIDLFDALRLGGMFLGERSRFYPFDRFSQQSRYIPQGDTQTIPASEIKSGR